MPRIELHTFIRASRETCFDLSRSVELHMKSTAGTGERAIAGKTSGLMNLHDRVTWRARHLGVVQNLTSVITIFEYPSRFVDEMEKGAFKTIHHEHIFRQKPGGTEMTDIFRFEAPLGVLGKLVCWLFLTRYMKKFLERRNQMLKQTAEQKEIA